MKEQYDRQKENVKYQTELLSYLINDESLYVKSIDIIRPEMFTDERRVIFDAYVSLISKNKKPDIVSISTESNISFDVVMEIGTYFSGVASDVNSLLAELYQYMALDKYMRLAQFLSNQVTAGTESETIKEHILKELRSLDFGNSSKVVTMEQGVKMVYDVIENNSKTTNCTGIPVGLSIIDKHMGGLQKGDLIILAGESSDWKTSFALSMLWNSAVLFGETCGIISHEMTTVQLMARLSGISTGIGGKQLLTGKLESYEFEQFNNKISGLIRSNLLIQDYISTELSSNISAVRLMVIQHNIKWVVLENAGNITIKDIKNNEELRTSTISRSLKNLAKELEITIILISHLSKLRDGVNKQPDTGRLKHSGQLEADADAVIFTYKADRHGFQYFNEVDSDDISEPTEGRLKVYYGKGRNYGMAKSFPYANIPTLYVTDNCITETRQIDLNPNRNFESDEPGF